MGNFGSNKSADSDSLPEIGATETYTQQDSVTASAVTGTVQFVYHDSEDRSIGDIHAAITRGNYRLRTIDASPVSRHCFTCPLPNEKVYLIQDQADGEWYYTSTMSNEGLINHMANGEQAQLAYSDSTKMLFNGRHFAPDIEAARAMDIFEGDTVLQGRCGTTIRLGQSLEKATTQPWNKTAATSDHQSPIMILRTGVLPVENLQYDYASIYLTSDQNIEIPLPTSLPAAIEDTQYRSSQVIMMSDRIIMSTRVDDIVLSSAKTIQLATKSWHHDIDVVLDSIEQLISSVTDIAEIVKQISTTSTTQTFPVPGVGTTLPTTQAPRFAQYTGKLATYLTDVKTISQNLGALKQK